MTNKRFTSRPTETPTFHLFEVLDNNERLAIMRDIDVDKVVELLNSQDNTIKQLTILLKEAEDEIEMLKESNKLLQESLLEEDS